MYRLYNVGDRTEPCDTPACISFGIDIDWNAEFSLRKIDRKL
jgi:hypothetical protein